MRRFLLSMLMIITTASLFAQPLLDTLVQIKTVTINANQPIDTVTPKKLFVTDYILTDNGIITLGFYGKAKHQKIIYLNQKFEIKDAITAPPYAEKIIKDCFNQVHVQLGQTVQQIKFLGFDLALEKQLSIAEFVKNIKPCIGENANHLYTKYNYLGDQVIQFNAYHKTLETNKPVATIADDEKIRQLKESKHGFLLASSADKYELFFATNSSKWWELIWEKEAFYQPVNAQMIAKKKELLVFNHLAGQLNKHKLNGELSASININYQRNKGWRPSIYFDEATQKVYTRIMEGRVSKIYEINTNNGQLSQTPIEIEIPFISNLKVHNNHIYFMYKVPGPNDKMTLYSQAI